MDVPPDRNLKSEAAGGVLAYELSELHAVVGSNALFGCVCGAVVLSSSRSAGTWAMHPRKNARAESIINDWY